MSGPDQRRSLELAVKPDSYYGQGRPELVACLDAPLGRVLEVGCGSGGSGQLLREKGAERLVGVEIEAGPAERARERYDEVHVGDVAALLRDGAIIGPFDTILAYDVLEHLADPASVLRALQAVAAPQARLHVCVPNARHASLMRDLVLRGTFGYTDWGHRDSTHLRWFTRRDLVAVMGAAGWPVERDGAIVRGRGQAVDRATRGAVREFIALQWEAQGRRGAG